MGNAYSKQHVFFDGLRQRKALNTTFMIILKMRQ